MCSASDDPTTYTTGGYTVEPRVIPHGWAVLVRYLGPTDHRGSRWVATADHPIGRAVVSYDHGTRQGAENARRAADKLVEAWRGDHEARYGGAFPYSVIAYGHLPNGDYAFIVG